MSIFYALLPTIVNTLAVVIGAGVGLLLHNRLAPRFRLTLFQALGLATLLIGLRDTLSTNEVLLVSFSLIAGGLVGEAINIEERLAGVGDWLKRCMGESSDDRFVEGFVFASLLFCVGAMALVGSFRAGVEGNGDTLYTKSLLDGHASLFLAGAMGSGVLASAASVFVFQGSLTLLFWYFGSDLPGYVVTEVGAAGGLLIVGISINLLEIGKIKIGNLLPAMFFAGGLVWLKSLL